MAHTPPILIVENGSGVRDANAYVDRAFVLQYLADRARDHENNWDTKSSDEQDSSIVLATDHIENRFRDLFLGQKLHRDISLARSTWTATVQPVDTETVTIGAQAYRLSTVLSVAGDVLIDVNLPKTIDNLIAAVIGGGGGGTKYHVDTVVNTSATAVGFIDNAMTVFALEAGTGGNGVSTTTTVTGAGWNFAATVGGSDIVRPQPLSFPRAYLVDRDGIQIVGIPLRLKWATAEYAVRVVMTGNATSSIAPDPTVDDYGGDVIGIREKVGPIETAVQYTPGSTLGGRMPNYPTADRLLREYLEPAGVFRG